MTSMLQQPSPACDVAVAALEVIGRTGPKGVRALVNQGAAPALFASIASPRASLQWRRRCVMAALPIAEAADINLLKGALASGLLPALLSMLHAASSSAADASESEASQEGVGDVGGCRGDESSCVLLAHALGALSWRSSSAHMRRSIREQLAAAGASRAPDRSLDRLPPSAGAERRGGAAARRDVGTSTGGRKGVECRRRAEDTDGGDRLPRTRARKATPAVPVPKAPVDKRRLAKLEEEEAAKAADLAAGVLPPQAAQVAGGGLAEAGTFDGAVGISEADARSMLSAAEAEAAAAIEGAAFEASAAVGAEASFLVQFLDRQLGGKAGGGGVGAPGASDEALPIASLPIEELGRRRSPRSVAARKAAEER